MMLLGKIFTMLIFVMSLVFMSFALAVFCNDTDWKAIATNDSPDRALGLRQQLTQQLNINKDLERQTQADQALLASMRSVRVGAVRELTAQVGSQAKELTGQDTGQGDAGKRKELRDKLVDFGQQTQELQTRQTLLRKQIDDLTVLHEQLKNTADQRNKYYFEVTKLVDGLYGAQGSGRRFQELNKSLAGISARYQEVFRRHKLSLEKPTGTPKLDGVVTAVNDSDQVEVSLGSDDGLEVNHELVVYRDSTYLGKVRVLRSDADRAVGQIIPGTKQGQIRKGDRVITKIS